MSASSHHASGKEVFDLTLMCQKAIVRKEGVADLLLLTQFQASPKLGRAERIRSVANGLW
jgi:hypothetical protein